MRETIVTRRRFRRPVRSDPLCDCIRRFAALLLALTLTLSLAAPAAAASGFTDVPAKHWAAAEIQPLRPGGAHSGARRPPASVWATP